MGSPKDGPSVAPLAMADFELALGFWKRLEDEIQAQLSVRFVKHWQSPAGAALSSEVLERFKPMWSHTRPNQQQRLAPARACGLGWTKEETLALLESHVDLNGDSQQLVGELIERGFFPKADEPLDDAGLVGALTWTRPELAAERLLAGTLKLDGVQPTIARALAAALVAPDVQLGTERAARHFERFVSTLGACVAPKTNAALAMMPHLVTAWARLPAEQRASRRSSAPACCPPSRPSTWSSRWRRRRST